jgi:hypothetical protein
MNILDRIVKPWYKAPSLWDLFVVVAIFTSPSLIASTILIVILAVHTEVDYRIKEESK